MWFLPYIDKNHHKQNKSFLCDCLENSNFTVENSTTDETGNSQGTR
jgi:hypothetical protein